MRRRGRPQGQLDSRTAHNRAAHAIALFGRLKQAGFVVGIASGPVAVGGLVDCPLEIADLVILVPFGVPAHGLAVLWMYKLHTELVVPGGFRLSGLPDMLTTLSHDQSIDRVIDVVIVRRDDLIVEENGLLGIVPNVRDVTGWVVGVPQVL